MALKEAKCPGCGAPIQFSAGSSLVVVCDHCSFAVARTDRDIESVGKVAAPADTETTFTRGQSGMLDGVRFTVVGRLQLAWAQGTWDEWYAALEDGRWCWLAEAQGKLYATFRAGLKLLPAWSTLSVGGQVTIPGAGTFTVAEKNEARTASAAGELPVRIKPGESVYYADVVGAGSRFGTIDYGDDPNDTEPEVYLGREVTFAELALSEVGAERRAVDKAKGAKLTCPKCNAPVQLQVPDESMRVTCAFCNSLLDASQGTLKYLSALAKVRATPKIPLGKKGTLGNTEYVCIGFVRRECVVEGITYSWDEYLLHAPKTGFRWLIESNGHWSFVEPAKIGEVHAGQGTAQYAGVTYKTFSVSTARVAQVLGEFYWEVSIGETVDVTDFVAPPHVLSEEKTANEVTWSRGLYTEPNEVWKAFKLPGYPPQRTGVYLNQPSPTAAAARAIYTWAALFYAALVVFFVLFLVTAKRQVAFEHQFEAPPAWSGLAPAAQGADNAFFSDPFELSGSATNMEVELAASTSNNWVAVSGALINEETGEVDGFGVESAYYHGVEGGESWSEGSATDHEYLSSVPAGRYILRLEPQWDPSSRMPSYRIRLTWGVPRILYFIIAALALAVFPALAAFREHRFEQLRWADSSIGGGDDDEDGDDE